MTIGFNQRPRGLFGASRNIMPGDQPMAPAMAMPPMGLQQPMPQPQQQSSGIDERLFALGGLMANLGGVHNTAAQDYMASQQQGALLGQQQQMEAQKDALARAAERAEWKWRQDYERSNPVPTNNDTVADYEFLRMKLGDEAARAFLERQADPDVTVPLPNGQMYIGPRSGMMAAMGGQAAPQGQVPTMPVGRLTPLAEGGPSQPATGGFPRH